jgi:hypothetical protein
MTNYPDAGIRYSFGVSRRLLCCLIKATVGPNPRGNPSRLRGGGFTFICGTSNGGQFQIKRKTRRDRMRAAVPVQPLLEGASRPYAMFKDYWKYDWVLPVYRYEGIEPLLATLAEKVIAPAEGKSENLGRATAGVQLHHELAALRHNIIGRKAGSLQNLLWCCFPFCFRRPA